MRARAGGLFFCLLPILWPLVVSPTLAADPADDRPLVAIWRDFDGGRSASEAPHLRIAVWNDGRVIFARDARKWSHELMESRIDARRIAELRKAIQRTGAFELKGNCYLVPDAPVDCVMLNFGDKEQMMYWDEVEKSNYGIDIFPKAQHLKFKSCWKEVNKLALEAIPKESQPYRKRFERPPKSWRLKPPIQSE